jgi:hypothetical protein
MVLWRMGRGREADFSTALRFGRNDDALEIQKTGSMTRWWDPEGGGG